MEGSGESGAPLRKSEEEKFSTEVKFSNKRKQIKMNIKQSKQKQRGKRKSKKSFSKNMRFLGVNSAGLRPKLMTFKKKC